MAKDYSELEGKEVRYIWSGGGEEQLVMGGCDPDIGMTLYEKEDKAKNVICLNGPLSPVKSFGTWKDKKTAERVYKAMFYHIVAGFKSGVIYSDKIDLVKSAAANIPCGGVSSVNCAFSQ